MPPALTERAKWALLIGINKYPNFAPRGQLSGCVNDVQAMRQVLAESFKFPEDHIVLLTDEQATRDGILAAMKELTARVGKDEIVVFHYSGHGSQMTDREGDKDELDGLDETIVPFDSGRGSEPDSNRDITDDEIYLWLRDLTAKTTAVTLIFDCCHSGTIVRNVDGFGGEVRQVEPDLRPVEQLPPSPIPAGARVLLDGSRDLGPSGWLPLGERYVLIAGCNRNEKSFEMEEPPGVRHGALTFHLVRELVAARPGSTYRDIFEAMAPRVSSRFLDQHPQLEGARDLELFGVRRIEPMSFVPVLRRSGDRVVLGAGAACGLTAESHWAVYPPGTKTVEIEQRPLGIVELTSVQAVTSEGKILEEKASGEIQVGARAFERSHYLAEVKMPVEVEPSPSRGRDVQALMEGIESSRVLRLAKSGDRAQVRVYLLPPRNHVQPDAPVPMLGKLKEETWAVVGEHRNLLMPTHRRAEPGVASLLIENLEKISRYRRALDLRKDGSALTGKVDVRILRHQPGGKPQEPEVGPDHRPLFYEGDYLALEIGHQYDKPLYVYVLDFGLTGRIALAYPVSGADDPLPPGKPHQIWTREGEEVSLYIPEEYPFLPVQSDTEPVEGVETLKVFFSTHPADLFFHLQSAVRDWPIRAAGPASSLNDLLGATFGGGGYRDTRRQTDGPEDWTTLERSFRLRRPASSWIAASGRSL